MATEETLTARTQPLGPGRVFQVPYPFIRDTYTAVEEDGPYTVPCWRPGTRRVQQPYRWDEREADARGMQVLVVVAVCPLPGRYQPRVFYTQGWSDPDGKTFGKGTVRSCTLRRFTAMTQGYGLPYTLAGTAPVEEPYGIPAVVG